MYHRLRNRILEKQLLLALAISIGGLSVSALPVIAMEQPIQADKITSVGNLPLSVKYLKKSPQQIELYQLDNSALGNRHPLLMVHGLRGEFWADCFRWQKVCQYLNGSAEFRDRYKIYLARYDSYAPLPTLVPQFRSALQSFSAGLSGKPISIVALSMGGNVVVESMADKATEDRIDHVFTLATPFHGSPLFTENWILLSMEKSHILRLTQLDTCLPHQIYFSKHHNLLSNLFWDNSDRMMPQVDGYRLWFEPFHRRTISDQCPGNKPVFELDSKGQVDREKFTVYGGFLDEYEHYGPKHTVNWFVKTVVPEHMGDEHAVLRVLNRQMRYVMADRLHPTGKPDKLGLRTVYELNDGITPLSSSLFLPNLSMPGLPVVTVEGLTKLRELNDVHRARVFRNVDHLTFIDDYHPDGAVHDLRDELEPDRQAKPIFAWILNDILHDGQEEELAVGQARKTP